MFDCFKRKKNKIMNKLSEIDARLNGKHTLTSTPVILSNYFKEFMENTCIKDDYLNLIKGLDDESILNVQKFINRIRQVMTHGNHKHVLFDLSEEEANVIREMNVNFYQAIVEINENTWAYQHYLLPRRFFTPPVHFHKYYLDNFSNIDSSKCIIDAGAYIGDSALILSEYTNDKVYCFEPTCEAFRLLNKTIELNNLRNIVPIKMGLSNKEYEDDIYVHLSASSMNSFRDNGTNCEKISLTTIDKYVKQNNLQVGLIKADIEGLETLMLEGAKETICSQKPALIISIYHSAHDFFKIKPMIESWNLGYKFKITPPPRTPCVCGNLSFRGGF